MRWSKLPSDNRMQGFDQRKNIVVIGNGMVGHRFVEKLIQFDDAKQFKIVTFCEEPRAAYDRVGLTSFFAHRDAEKLMIARLDWYKEHGVELHLGDRANAIDRKRRTVTSDRGASIRYDQIVLATGSYPFVPPVEGIHKRGVFVYRTIEDLEKIRELVTEELPELRQRAKARLRELRDAAAVFAESRKVREAQGLSLGDVQRLTGIDRSALSKLERGERANFTVDTLTRYAAAVGKHMSFQLTDATEA